MTGHVALLVMMAGGSVIAAASAVVGAVVVLPPRGWQNLPWWERARLAYPSRVAPTISAFAVGMIMSWTGIVYFTVVGFRPPLPWFIISYITSILGAVAVAMFMAWRAAPGRRPLWYWLAGCASAMLV